MSLRRRCLYWITNAVSVVFGRQINSQQFNSLIAEYLSTKSFSSSPQQRPIFPLLTQIHQAISWFAHSQTNKANDNLISIRRQGFINIVIKAHSAVHCCTEIQFFFIDIQTCDIGFACYWRPSHIIKLHNAVRWFQSIDKWITNRSPYHNLFSTVYIFWFSLTVSVLRTKLVLSDSFQLIWERSREKTVKIIHCKWLRKKGITWDTSNDFSSFERQIKSIVARL